jgi:hypothetical protein
MNGNTETRHKKASELARKQKRKMRILKVINALGLKLHLCRSIYSIPKAISREL